MAKVKLKKKKVKETKLDTEYEKYVPFIVEVRRRLMFLVAIFLIASVLGFTYYEKIILFALDLFNLVGINIVFTSPFQYINLAISSGFFVGFLVTLPLLFFQVISFLRPALTHSEYKLLVTLIPLAIFLFIVGFSFGIFVMRYVLVLFYEKSVELDIGNLLDISQFLSQMIVTSLLMGCAFLYPVVLTALMKLKVITYQAVAKQRLIAYSASLIFAAFLPPTDLLSLALLTVPLIFLFETTLMLNKIILKSHLMEN